MGLEGAVRLGMRRELEAIEDPEERERVFEATVAAAYERGRGVNMAAYGEIDDVIDPADSRRWIAHALRRALRRRGARATARSARTSTPGDGGAGVAWPGASERLAHARTVAGTTNEPEAELIVAGSRTRGSTRSRRRSTRRRRIRCRRRPHDLRRGARASLARGRCSQARKPPFSDEELARLSDEAGREAQGDEHRLAGPSRRFRRRASRAGRSRRAGSSALRSSPRSRRRAPPAREITREAWTIARASMRLSFLSRRR